MSQKDKLEQRFKSIPKDFTFEELETLLNEYGYYLSNKGKTSGSRICFTCDKSDTKIMLHKPHNRKVLLEYQIKQVKNQLEQEGLL
ncbi:MAG: type II toxin-antitoxin system HicA family toxin [Lachnospiraceae bacterium]|nr:type II toxin-antitoxin system HicA family toxin [Lachnospiraceae bacterium]